MMMNDEAVSARAAGIDDPGRVGGGAVLRPDPEVPKRARQRSFTAQYKLDILSEYDAVDEGAVLRREGLYTSHIVLWRRARDAGALAGLKAPRALSQAERAEILAELHSDRFVDMAPAEVWAILLDEGRYRGSVSTFYRLLRSLGEVKERRW